MGAGGEATRRWASRRADARAEAPQEACGKSDLRRGTRGAFARGRRQTSYEKLHELADWKRIGLHDKYADATMVRDPDHERGERARRRRATVRSASFQNSARRKPSDESERFQFSDVSSSRARHRATLTDVSPFD